MRTIRIKLNIEKDIWNWWEACNKVSHGVDWKRKIPKKLREKVVGKDFEEAFNLMKLYLEGIYSKNNYFKKHISLTQNAFNSKKNIIFIKMEEITKHRIYRDNFTCFVTTFPRFPYSYQKGYVWISHNHNPDYELATFIHELLHFQFMKYYGEKVWDEVGEEKYQFIKEGMTVILNDEFSNITSEKDNGYTLHAKIRKFLKKKWLEKRDMDYLVEQGIVFLKSDS